MVFNLMLIAIYFLFFLEFTFSFCTSEMVYQDNLEMLDDPINEYILDVDVLNVSSVVARAWDFYFANGTNMEPYGDTIREYFTFNNLFNQTMKRYDSENQVIPETLINSFADTVYDQVIVNKKPLHWRMRRRWQRLKFALKKQYINNMAVIVYNEFEDMWTYCTSIQLRGIRRSFFGRLGDLPLNLRVCCAHALLGVPPITRKPVIFLDYIPHYIIENHYLRRTDSSYSPYLSRRKVPNQPLPDNIVDDHYGEDMGLENNNSSYFSKQKVSIQSLLSKSGNSMSTKQIEIDDNTVTIDLFYEEEELFSQNCTFLTISSHFCRLFSIYHRTSNNLQ